MYSEEAHHRDHRVRIEKPNHCLRGLCSTSLQPLRAAGRFCGTGVSPVSTGETPVPRLAAAAPRCGESFEACRANHLGKATPDLLLVQGLLTYDYMRSAQQGCRRRRHDHTYGIGVVLGGCLIRR
jgi:hypothetical protein